MNRPHLTRLERDRLRAAIDAHVRARLADGAGCKGCGAAYDARTIGCTQCTARFVQRRRHADPETLEIDRARWRKYGVAKRARARARKAA